MEVIRETDRHHSLLPGRMEFTYPNGLEFLLELEQIWFLLRGLWADHQRGGVGWVVEGEGWEARCELEMF